MRNVVAAFLLCLTFVVGSATGQTDVARGWRPPTPAEQTFPGDQWRDDSPERYLVARADFDGDGKPDQAKLLVSADGSTYGLFVFLGSGAGLHLDSRELSALKGMGIDTIAPGTHETACGKGYWACTSGEPERLRLRHPGILYFKTESAASVYFWSVPDRAFQRVWLSD